MRFKSSLIITAMVFHYLMVLFILNTWGSFNKTSFNLLEYKQSEMNSNLESKSDLIEENNDTGYITPAATMIWSNITVAKSFLFSKVSSQEQSLERIRKLSNKWYNRNNSVYIMADYIIKAILVKTGIHHESVPKYYYKIILRACDIDKDPSGLFVSHDKLNLVGLPITIDKIEEISSIDLFNLISDTPENSRSKGTYNYYTW